MDEVTLETLCCPIFFYQLRLLHYLLSCFPITRCFHDISMISFTSSFEIISVVMPDTSFIHRYIVFFCIAASVANAAVVNPNCLKMLLANGASAFLINARATPGQLLDEILVLLVRCCLYYHICEFLPCHTFFTTHHFQDTFHCNVHIFLLRFKQS